jgi:3-dehydroquinate dehydratase
MCGAAVKVTLTCCIGRLLNPSMHEIHFSNIYKFSPYRKENKTSPLQMAILERHSEK